MKFWLLFVYICTMENVFLILTNTLKDAIPGIKAVYLFGSQANGTAHLDSDYDIAFLATEKQFDELFLFRLKQSLELKLNADVDLINLRAATTVLQFQIISTGVRIYCIDDFFCNSFDLMVYSSYQHLHEERREIIEDIKKRGYVYAR